MRVAVSWSGGKDSCHACFKAMEEGFEIQKLLTMMSNGTESAFHLVKSDMLDAQSRAIGIPIMKNKTMPETYETDFRNALRQLRNTGIEGLVTGDIFDVVQHEAGWLERICRETDLKPIRPLWHRNPRHVLEEFINLSFKAKVVRVKLAVLTEEFLGKDLDEDFYSELAKLGNVDPCGEGGEYHTIVTDGPLFNDRIEILETRKTATSGWGKLEILRFQLQPKRKVKKKNEH